MISTSIFALLATVALALSPMGSTPTNPDDANMQARVDSIPKGNSNNNLWWQGSQNDNIESGYYKSYN